MVEDWLLDEIQSLPETVSSPHSHLVFRLHEYVRNDNMVRYNTVTTIMKLLIAVPSVAIGLTVKSLPRVP